MIANTYYTGASMPTHMTPPHCIPLLQASVLQCHQTLSSVAKGAAMIDIKINRAHLKISLVDALKSSGIWPGYLVKPPNVPRRSNDTWIVSGREARNAKLLEYFRT